MKDALTKKDREAIKQVAKALLEKLRDGRSALDRLHSMATVQAQMKAEIIKHLFVGLPSEACDADEIDLKAGAVFAHIYISGLGDGARVYH